MRVEKWLFKIESLQRQNKGRFAENSHSEGNSKTVGKGRFQGGNITDRLGTEAYFSLSSIQ